MTLTKSRRLGSVTPVIAYTPDKAVVEPGANEISALDFITGPSDAESADWVYSSTAEDNGVAGVLDGSPGFVYVGPRESVSVRVADVDLTDNIKATLGAADFANVCVYKNSELASSSDEGWNTHEASVEYNVDTVMDVQSGDVVRVAVQFSGEEADADLTLAEGGVISIG
jgi:hypothetical protein